MAPAIHSIEDGPEMVGYGNPVGLTGANDLWLLCVKQLVDQDLAIVMNQLAAHASVVVLVTSDHHREKASGRQEGRC